MNWAAIVWFVLMLGFLVVEAACAIHLVSIWFAAGSLVAMLWPFIKKFLNPNLTKTNVDAIIGTEGRVTAAIDNVSAVGQVKLGAMEWTARSTSGEPIPQGTLVRVDRIEGVKAFVSTVKVIETV